MEPADFGFQAGMILCLLDNTIKMYTLWSQSQPGMAIKYLEKVLEQASYRIASDGIPFSIFNHSLSDMRGDHTLYHHFIILEWHMWKKKGGKDKEEKVIHLLSLCKQLEPQPYPSPKVKAQINMKEFYKLIMHAWKLINMVMSIFC